MHWGSVGSIIKTVSYGGRAATKVLGALPRTPVRGRWPLTTPHCLASDRSIPPSPGCSHLLLTNKLLTRNVEGGIEWDIAI